MSKNDAKTPETATAQPAAENEKTKPAADAENATADPKAKETATKPAPDAKVKLHLHTAGLRRLHGVRSIKDVVRVSPGVAEDYIAQGIARRAK